MVPDRRMTLRSFRSFTRGPNRDTVHDGRILSNDRSASNDYACKEEYFKVNGNENN